jgi:guanylate kinase
MSSDGSEYSVVAEIPAGLREGMLIVVSSPSGGGKSTLLARLFHALPDLRYSISYTTRPPRPGEVDGRDYHFVTEAEFARMRAAGELLESAQVHGNQYGTSRLEIESELAHGQDIVLDIDVQGAAAIRAIMPDSVRIFIMPPGFDVLSQRLRARGSDAPEVVERRLRNARAEVTRFREFQYVVVNDDLETAVQELTSIVRAERRRWTRSEAHLKNIVNAFTRSISE